MKRLVILGSTGSVGKQTLDVVREHPRDFKITGLATRKNSEALEQQITEFRPSLVAVTDENRAKELRRRVSVPVLSGESALAELAAHDAADFMMNALVGTVGIRPTLAAIRSGKTVGLANKETLVSAGEIVMREAAAYRAEIIPVDSEHNAIFQCLRGESQKHIRRIILTASGGPFRDTPREKLKDATAAEALQHPTWKMGRKISIDSATMMNKGFEVIEAMHLFGLAPNQIGVIVHPESIVHSMVEFVDHSVIAQMSVPDMRIPIQYALFYPRRAANAVPALALDEIGTLHFQPADTEKFPCLALAYDAARIGGTMPAVMNTANDLLVERFLAGDIKFLGISAGVRKIMEKHTPQRNPNLEDILAAIAWTRECFGIA